MYDQEHLEQLVEIARRHRLPIIADEVYEQLAWGERFVSLAAVAREVPVLVCGGVAKRFLAPGWRLGWLALHDPLNLLPRVSIRNLCARTIGANTLVQAALPTMLLLTPQSFHDDLINTLHVSCLPVVVVRSSLVIVRRKMPRLPLKCCRKSEDCGPTCRKGRCI